MRKLVMIGLAVPALSLSFVSPSVALPPAGFSVAPQEDVQSSLDEARLFCYNRDTGRFKHWGACGGGYRAASRPRVYCRNRFSGQFLHWGSCWG